MAARSRQSSYEYIQPPRPDQCSLNFNSRSAKQPLYRPAALRRNTGSTVDLLHSPSPPLSPAPSAQDLRSSWLAGLAAAAPWSPVSDLRGDADSAVRGSLLPRALWKLDAEAVVCADDDCSVSFGLIHRKHHCRRCGQVFCAAHSARTSLLWSTGQDADSTPSPLPTPRSTPRSSTLDVPSLLPYFTSPSASAVYSASSAGTTPRSSPPSALPPPGTPVSARVCDACYFSSARTASTPPPSSHASAKPLSLRHPPKAAHPSLSPAQSPPEYATMTVRGGASRNKSRSRQSSGTPSSLGSVVSGGSNTSPSTAASSVEGTAAAFRPRGVSPSTSIRKVTEVLGCGLVDEEDEGDVTEDAEDADGKLPSDDPAYGSVIGWGSHWATF